MKTFKKMILACATMITIALGSSTVMAQGSIAQPFSSGGYPVYQGYFISGMSVPTNNATGGTIWSQVWFPATIPTNNAVLSIAANPLTTGGLYTTPPADGFVRAELSATNGQSAMLTNYTAGEGILLGTVAGGTMATNFVNGSLRTGPGDIVAVTNMNSTPLLLNSSWRN